VQNAQGQTEATLQNFEAVAKAIPCRPMWNSRRFTSSSSDRKTEHGRNKPWTGLQKKSARKRQNRRLFPRTFLHAEHAVSQDILQSLNDS
jgi:hypothetical protein